MRIKSRFSRMTPLFYVRTKNDGYEDGSFFFKYSILKKKIQKYPYFQKNYKYGHFLP